MGDWLAYPRWCTSPPPHLGWWMGLYHGDVRVVCCHAEIDWYESFPPRARWSFLHGPFLRGGRCWCVRGSHSERKPVRREFGLVLGHGQVVSNDQVSDNFVLVLELGRFGREAFALIQCGLDLATDRDQSLEWYLS